jgi:hypothetical protein
LLPASTLHPEDGGSKVLATLHNVTTQSCETTTLATVRLFIGYFVVKDINFSAIINVENCVYTSEYESTENMVIL